MSTAARPDSAAARKRELAAIHIAAQRLGLDDETYRQMLWTVARVSSARELDHAGRARVLDHLAARGAPVRRAGTDDRRAQIRKIDTLLAELTLPRDYAVGILRRQAKVDALEFATPIQLRGVIAALVIHRRRRAAPK